MILRFAVWLILIGILYTSPSLAKLRKLDDVHLANLVNASKAVVATLEQVGQPLADADLIRLRTLWAMSGDAPLAEIQDILNRYVLVDIWIDEEGWLKPQVASADPRERPIFQNQWKYYLVRVYNQSAVKAPVNVRSPQELLPDELEQAEAGSTPQSSDSHSWYRWIGLRIAKEPIEVRDFPGPTVRYLVLGIFSRDPGMRSATLEFYFGGGAVAQGHYVRQRILFQAVVDPLTPIR